MNRKYGELTRRIWLEESEEEDGSVDEEETRWHYEAE